MSLKKAQSTANQVYDRTGVNLVQFQNDELEWLKSQLEEFLELETATDELTDPEDCEVDLEALDEEE